MGSWPRYGVANRPEIDALLAAPDQQTWLGRRDHALMLVAVQTGLRLSELTGLQRAEVVWGTCPSCMGRPFIMRCSRGRRILQRSCS